MKSALFPLPYHGFDGGRGEKDDIFTETFMDGLSCPKNEI